MAVVAGKDATFKLDNSSGTLTALTAYVEAIDTNWERQTEEVTTLNNSAVRIALTLEKNEFSVSFVYDRTVYDHMKALWQANGTASTTTRSFEISPEGTTSGYPKESGEAFLTSFGRPVKVGSILRFTCKFLVDGVVTFGVNP